MGGLNFIGSNNDDADEKQSRRYDFDYTDPEKDKANSSHLKPRTSFFGRHKKKTPIKSEEPKKVSEAQFVDKQQVRKGKYKPTSSKPQTQKSADQSTSAVSTVYAPTRSTTQSSVQPTFAQVNRTELNTAPSTFPVSSAPQQPTPSQSGVVLPESISPTVFPAVPSAQTTSQVPSPSAMKATPSTTSPLSTTPKEPSVSTSSATPLPSLQPSIPVTTPHSVQPVATSASVPAHKTGQTFSSGERPRVIPIPPPPPVHAAPMPAAVKTTATAMPAMQNMQQSGHQKMYDTGTEVRSNTIIEQPIVAPTVPITQPVPLQAVPNPELPHLPVMQQPPIVQQIPIAPAPPVHIAPTPPVTPTSPAIKPVQPARSSRLVPTQVETGMPATAHTTNAHSVQVGVVYAQNVESIHGEKTNPEPITGKFLAVNLLPADFLKDLTPASKIVGLIKVALISCTVLGLTYGIMVGYQSYFIIQTKNNQQEINRLEQEILTYAPLQNDINTTNVQLQSVSTLLAQHIYWSNVFAMLEKYTLPNVSYQNFSGSTSGLISLQALTTDFSSISRQIHILNTEAPFVQSATSTTASRSAAVIAEESAEETPTEVSVTDSSDIVAFTINLHIDPAIFLYQSNANYNGNN